MNERGNTYQTGVYPTGGEGPEWCITVQRNAATAARSTTVTTRIPDAYRKTHLVANSDLLIAQCNKLLGVRGCPRTPAGTPRFLTAPQNYF